MPHDDPIRLRVQKALGAALAAVTPAGGYVSDLSGGKVFRGRLVFGEGDPLPMVSILEAPIPPEQIFSPADASEAAGPWEIILQGFCIDDRVNPTDPAHILLADIKRCVALEKKKVTSGKAFGITEITNLVIGPGVVRPPDEVSAKAYCWLLLTIHLAEDMAAPYD